MNHLNNKSENRPIIFFDGYCNLCSASVQFVLKYERSAYFYFSSLQSGFAKAHLPEIDGNENADTVILFQNGKIYYESDAILRVCEKLKFPLWLAYYFIYVPKFLRDPIYRLIAKNRVRFFGRRMKCYMAEEKYKHRFFE